jgi:hypothetical protein
MVCTLLTLIQYSIEISSQSNETGERNKKNSNKEGRVKLSLFADDKLLYQKTLKNVKYHK